MKNNTKYAEQVKVGDNIVLSNDDIQKVKSVVAAGNRNICIEFVGGHSIIVGVTTKIPVILNRAEINYTIEEMYNLILDDGISLVDFTAWCRSIQ